MNLVTYLPALAGGILIGISATLLLWLNGRIAGISGILNGAMDTVDGDRGWRWLFLLGLLIGAGAWFHWSGAGYFAADAYSPRSMTAAGLLVGAGTRIGSGCTSGHGICGLGRLSVRSLVATLTFMSTAVATVFVIRFVLRRSTPVFETQFHLPAKQHVDVPLVLGAALFGIGWGLAGYCPGPALASLIRDQRE